MELLLIRKWIEDIPKKYVKLLLVVGKSGQMEHISKQMGYPCINLNLELSRRLLDIPENKRAVHINSIFTDILDTYESEVLFVDRIEVLFARQLMVNPLKLLEMYSRNKGLIVLWPGKYEKRKLTYAEPDHPEYMQYKVNGSIDIISGEVLK